MPSTKLLVPNNRYHIFGIYIEGDDIPESEECDEIEVPFAVMHGDEIWVAVIRSSGAYWPEDNFVWVEKAWPSERRALFGFGKYAAANDWHFSIEEPNRASYLNLEYFCVGTYRSLEEDR